MYRNAYVPKLTTKNGVAWFFRGHLGRRFASTKEAGPMTDRFVSTIAAFHLGHDLELVRFQKGQRKGRETAKTSPALCTTRSN